MTDTVDTVINNNFLSCTPLVLNHLLASYRLQKFPFMTVGKNQLQALSALLTRNSYIGD